MTQSSGQAFFVFVGPSFPLGRARELAPFADVRGPIRRGDLEGMEEHATVAIIDGIFGGEFAISPREIRIAIARGVRVAGAAGTGALRAAEVPEMLGLGRVYDMYRSGTLQRDDEIAVAVNADETRLTESLVNVRFAVDTLVRAGTLAKRNGALIVEAASDLHYLERTYPNIVEKAGLSHLADREDLIRILRSVDVQAEDSQALLERLEEVSTHPRWHTRYVTGEARLDSSGNSESTAALGTTSADAPLRVWEFGEELQWPQLFDFLAVTGQLDRHARRAIARAARRSETSLCDDPSISSVQDLFTTAMEEWGWEGAEEVHVTLRDLGIASEDLQTQLLNERNVRRELRGLVTSRDANFMRALRLELFMTDLSLKREIMRLGSLLALAHENPTDGERIEVTETEDAKRALLCNRPELTWDGLLDETGIGEAAADNVVTLIASARRVGTSILDTMMNASSAHEVAAKGIEALPAAPYADGSTSRSIGEHEALVIAEELGRIMGVTRIAQVGEIGRFGLHVASAYRASTWSSTVGSGKSESPEGAAIGAIMEELEKFCQERFEPDIVSEASFRELTSDRAIDPSDCALPYDSTYRPEQPLAWTWMSELFTNRNMLVPSALLSVGRTRNDILYSSRKGARVFLSNGLGCGFTLTEALFHALCERIERHALKLAEQEITNPGPRHSQQASPFEFIDLRTCPESTQRLVAMIRRAGYELRAMDVTCEIAVPTFAVRIFQPAVLHGLDGKYATGSCSHANPEIAINRAILEAVQTGIVAISGAREDLGVQARSLGRHERPRPLSCGDAYWIRPYVPKKSLSTVRGFTGRNAREELDFILRRLSGAKFDRVLYRDLSCGETAPACVVRALVPGMECTNPFYTGLRARTLMVQDLMRRHEW